MQMKIYLKNPINNSKLAEVAEEPSVLSIHPYCKWRSENSLVLNKGKPRYLNATSSIGL